MYTGRNWRLQSFLVYFSRQNIRKAYLSGGGKHLDLFQIIMVHNREWTGGEKTAFFIMLVILAAVLFIFVKKRKLYISQAISGIALFIYLAFVFASTVFTRNPGNVHCEFVPFWSWYEVIAHHDFNLFVEIILNCVMLLPMGLLLPFVLNRKVKKAEAYIYGFILALAIELLQLILRRGWFEWDDMIHNGFGCMLGCVLAELVMGLVKKNGKR